MGELILMDKKADVEDTEKIIQITFFDDITSEDIRKTKWLLGKYTDMVDICRNYEIAMREMENGLSAYDLLCAEGTAGKRESGHELTADVTANTVILKDKREANYKFYKVLCKIVEGVVNNLRDPHEQKIARLLFIEGRKYLKSQTIMESGMRKGVPGISATTFADKRRRVIANITQSLKINRTLDFVVIDYGRGRNQDGEIGLRMPNQA